MAWSTKLASCPGVRWLEDAWSQVGAKPFQHEQRQQQHYCPAYQSRTQGRQSPGCSAQCGACAPAGNGRAGRGRKLLVRRADAAHVAFGGTNGTWGSLVPARSGRQQRTGWGGMGNRHRLTPAVSREHAASTAGHSKRLKTIVRLPHLPAPPQQLPTAASHLRRGGGGQQHQLQAVRLGHLADLGRLLQRDVGHQQACTRK